MCQIVYNHRAVLTLVVTSVVMISVSVDVVAWAAGWYSGGGRRNGAMISCRLRRSGETDGCLAEGGAIEAALRAEVTASTEFCVVAEAAAAAAVFSSGGSAK